MTSRGESPLTVINVRSRFSVLIVDDEPLIVGLTKRWLSDMGVRAVHTALNGRDALDLLSTMPEPPDVIITDLNMPGMDGVEFLRHVAARKIMAGVIIASGEDARLLAMVHELALHHGLNVLGVMPKPLTQEALVKLLNDLGSVSASVARPALESITEAELDAGLAANGLALVFQPKVSMATRTVVGVEALARWNHPERGILPPPAFITLAEETGRIAALTKQVLRMAVMQSGEWKAAGLEIPVSVNVSTSDLEDVTLPDFAMKCLEEAQLRPSYLTLEVTESRIMKKLKTSMDTLSRFRLKGFGLSIDDFGTGYASLEQLKSAPFTEVKVDRAFVHQASTDSTSRAILESSISLGQKLKMHVVAEGAETQTDWDLLAELKCEVVQGYYVARPMRDADLRAWIPTWTNSL